MAHYLLDPNILSYLADRASPFHQSAHANLSLIADTDEVSLSVLSLYELHHWFAYRPEQQLHVDRVLRPFRLLPVPEVGAAIFGRLMRELRRTPARADLQRHAVNCVIAVTALEHGAVLVSSDRPLKDVAAVIPALELRDWSASTAC